MAAELTRFESTARVWGQEEKIERGRGERKEGEKGTTRLRNAYRSRRKADQADLPPTGNHERTHARTHLHRLCAIAATGVRARSRAWSCTVQQPLV